MLVARGGDKSGFFGSVIRDVAVTVAYRRSRYRTFLES